MIRFSYVETETKLLVHIYYFSVNLIPSYINFLPTIN